jgi:cytoskeletal protein CcmA (bactofilin family)
VLLFGAGVATQATTFVWTNIAGGNWSNPTNWSPNQVPGQLNSTSNTDDVLITNWGGYTVTFDVGDTNNFWGVHSILVGHSALSIQNRTTIQTASLDVTNGAIVYNVRSTIRGPFTIEVTAQLVSSVGTYYGPVTIGGTASVAGDSFYQQLTINTGASVTMTSDSSQYGAMTVNGLFNISSGYFYLSGPLTNSGTITFYNTSYGGNAINILNDGTTNFQGGLLNLPGGTINLNNAYYHGIQGLYGREYFINRGVLTCTNSGTVNVPIFDNTGGTVTDWWGALDLGQFTNAFAGTFYAAASSGIGLSGGTATTPLAPGNALSFYGSGTFSFLSGYLLLTNDLIPVLQLSWGNLELGPDFQGGAITNLTFASMSLTNTTLPLTGIMNVTGSTAQIYGNLTVAGGGLLNLMGGTVHGVMTVASNGTVTSTSGSFANDCSLTVTGTLNVVAATFLSGLTTNFSTINLFAPMYLGRLVNEAGGVINILTNGAAVQNSTPTNALINYGSIIKGSYSSTAAINITGFTNAGSVTAQSGLLQLNHLTLQPTGSLNVRLNNANDYGKFSISGAATIAGSFSAVLATNYSLNAGDVFQPLTYGSEIGNFTAVGLPPWIGWQTTYGTTAFSLLVTTTNIPPLFTTVLRGNSSVSFHGTNGAPGKTYWILTGTNLAEPIASWAPVTTNTIQVDGQFGFTNAVDPAQRQQFFILKLQ